MAGDESETWAAPLKAALGVRRFEFSHFRSLVRGQTGKSVFLHGVKLFAVQKAVNRQDARLVNV